MYETLLVLHFIGLALGVGTAFANLTLGMATKDMDPPERVKFMLRASALSKNGSIGITLLLLSGVGMWVMKGISATMAQGGGAFHAKLGLVVVLCGLLGYIQVLMKKAKRDQGGPNMAKLPKVGRAMLLVGVAIVVCAVMAFE